jgi:hypothetical protein
LDKIAEKDSVIADKDKEIADIKVELNSKNKEIEDANEKARVAEITPLVQNLLYAKSYKPDSEVYKEKEAELMKLEKKELLRIAEFSLRDLDLEKQKEIIKGNFNLTGMPIQNRELDLFSLDKKNEVGIPKDKLKSVV